MSAKSFSLSHGMLLLGLTFFLVASGAWAGDWQQWRGPSRDSVSAEKQLLDDWTSPPKLLWRAQGIGDGYASLAVADGVIYTMGNHGRNMDVVALSAKDGKLLWRTTIGKALKGHYGGSRSTPTVDDDRLYVLHPFGNLVCLKAATGELVWKNDLADYHGNIPMHGFAESPLVDDGKVICTPNSPNAAVVALDKMTGKEIWHCAVTFDGQRPEDMKESYASAVVSHGAGVKQYVQLLGVGLVGIDPKSGKQLWSYSRLTNNVCHGQNIHTPIIRGDYVFGVSAFDGRYALLQLARSQGSIKAREVYYGSDANIGSHVDGVLLVGDHVYVSGRFQACIELLTGKTVWKERGPASGNASMLYADGNLYVHYENGLMALIRADPTRYQLQGKFKPSGAPEAHNSWAHTALSEGQLYVRERDALYCYDLKKQGYAERARKRSARVS
jgi:outer membrane protein assembly factor BamB